MGDTVTAWPDIDSNDLLPGEPFTSAKALAFRDRPVAISEGSDGAPKIQPAAMKCNIIGMDEDSIVDFTSTEDISYVWFDVLHMNVSGVGTSGSIAYQYRTATDGGATPTGWTTLVSGGAGSASDYAHYNGGVTLPAGTDYIQIRTDATGASPGTPEVLKFTAFIFGEDSA